MAISSAVPTKLLKVRKQGVEAAVSLSFRAVMDGVVEDFPTTGREKQGHEKSTRNTASGLVPFLISQTNYPADPRIV